MRHAELAKRNFVRQQGFADEPAESCVARYPGLMWQPRIVALLVAAGIATRYAPGWAGLGALLWFNALVPAANPFDRAYDALVAGPRGGDRLPVARAPRRFSQGMAGTLMIATGLALHQGLSVLAWVLMGMIALAIVALVGFRFCLGSFVYYHLRGEGVFARKTAPWASGEA
jgi:hypothetical protein